MNRQPDPTTSPIHITTAEHLTIRQVIDATLEHNTHYLSHLPTVKKDRLLAELLTLITLYKALHTPHIPTTDFIEILENAGIGIQVKLEPHQ